MFATLSPNFVCAAICLHELICLVHVLVRVIAVAYRAIIPECWYVPSPTRKETSSEACQGRAPFQQHRDASCHQVFFLQSKAPNEIHAILTEILACFFPGRAEDLPAPLYMVMNVKLLI